MKRIVRIFCGGRCGGDGAIVSGGHHWLSAELPSSTPR